MWDESHGMESQETPLQRFVRLAIEESQRARDSFDKKIQKASGTSGKPLYDLQRGKAKNPGTQMLKYMAGALGQPFELMRQASEGEFVDPISIQPDEGEEKSLPQLTLEDIAAENGWVLIDEIDLSFGMGATFLDQDRAPERLSIIPFSVDWISDLHRGPVSFLKIVRGRGDSMEPTIRDGDLVLIDTSRRRLDEQDVIWAVSYGELGMIRRLRQMPGGGVQMMPDNSVVRPTEAYDGEMNVIGRVIWIGRRM